MHAILVALAVLTAPGDPPRLRYAVVGEVPPVLVASFEADVTAGYRLLCEAAGSPGKPPRLERVTDPAAADLVLNSALHPARPWQVAGLEVNGRPPVVFNAPNWGDVRKDATWRARVACHELGHLYFALPDQYGFGPDGRPKSDGTGCPMDFFEESGWTGKLCDPCKALVRRRWARTTAPPRS